MRQLHPQSGGWDARKPVGHLSAVGEPDDELEDDSFVINCPGQGSISTSSGQDGINQSR
jgi:hypothetical protein